MDIHHPAMRDTTQAPPAEAPSTFSAPPRWRSWPSGC